MGFDSGLYKAKRMKGITPTRLDILDSYLDYCQAADDSHTKLNYSTWEEYANSFMQWKNTTDTTITQEEKDFYINNQDNQYDREYRDGKSVYTEIETWCSNGRVFDDWLTILLGGDSYDYYFKPKELTKEDIVACLAYIREEYLEKRLKLSKATCHRSYFAEDEEEDDRIILTRCTGIEITNDEGETTRIYTDDLECSELVVGYKYYDEWADDAWMRLYDALVKILCEVDFEKEIVMYGSGC